MKGAALKSKGPASMLHKAFFHERRHPMLPGFLALLLFILLPMAAAEANQADAAPPGPLGNREAGEEASSRPMDVPERLVLANQDYLEGDYAEAAKAYEAILESGHRNGHLLYNLGNCYVRLGETGRAILNYKRALLFLPRDGDLKANLHYARSLTQDRIEQAPSSLWRTLAFWYFGMSFKGLLLAFCILNVLFWGSLLVRLFRDSEWVRWSIALTLLISLVMAASATIKYVETFHNRGGVVLLQEAPVRAGFSHKDTTLFILHEGAEFRILDQEKGWWKIELPDGKKGWLPTDSGGRISSMTHGSI